MTEHTLVLPNGIPSQIFSNAEVYNPGQLEVVEGRPPNFNSYWMQGAWHELPAKPSMSHEWNGLAWADPRSVQELRLEKRAEIKAAREAAEYGGFVWDGSTFDSDMASQMKIQGQVLAVSVLGPSSRDWTLADNSVRTLSAADLMAVGGAMAAHIGTVFSHGQALQAQVEAATTAAEIQAIHW